MNPFATGALLTLALAHVMLAWAVIRPSAEEVHFQALQEFCKQQAARNPAADAYFVCMARLGRKEASHAFLSARARGRI